MQGGTGLAARAQLRETAEGHRRVECLIRQPAERRGLGHARVDRRQGRRGRDGERGEPRGARARGAHEVLWRPVQLVQMQPGDGDRNGDCGGSGKVMVLVVVVMVVVVVVVVIATGCSPWRGGAAVELLQHTYCGSTCYACCGRAAATHVLWLYLLCLLR